MEGLKFQQFTLHINVFETLELFLNHCFTENTNLTRLFRSDGLFVDQ